MRTAKVVLRLPKVLDCALAVSEELAEALSDLARCPLTHSCDIESEHHVGIKGETCNACEVVTSSGCYIDSAEFRAEGVMQWMVMAPTTAALDALTKGTMDRGCAVIVEEVTVIRTAKELTKGQEKVLELALELGYFDVPRKVTIRVLADRLDMPKSTLEIVLRRAEHKVLADHMGDR